MQSMPISTILLAFVSLVYCQYYGDLLGTPSAFESFNISLPGDKFTLNYNLADKDLTVSNFIRDV